MISEKKLIGISIIEPSDIEIKVSELVTLTIERTPSGQYCVAEGEKEVIDLLLFEILENAQLSSTTFLAVEIPQRRRTRRRRKAIAETTSGECDRRRRVRRGEAI